MTEPATVRLAVLVWTSIAAFGTLGLPRVISMTDPPNLRSVAVLRRLGMTFDHEAEIEDMGRGHGDGLSGRGLCGSRVSNGAAAPQLVGAAFADHGGAPVGNQAVVCEFGQRSIGDTPIAVAEQPP